MAWAGMPTLRQEEKSESGGPDLVYCKSSINPFPRFAREYVWKSELQAELLFGKFTCRMRSHVERGNENGGGLESSYQFFSIVSISNIPTTRSKSFSEKHKTSSISF